MSYLVLLGGGRGEERKIAARSLRDIDQVLDGSVAIMTVWLDEHGGLWQKKNSDGWQAVCFSQNRVCAINTQELVVGQQSYGEKIQMVWPVVFGGSGDWSGLACLPRMAGCQQLGTSGLLAVLLKDNVLATRILTEYDFVESALEIEKNDWQTDEQNCLQMIASRLNFPVVMLTGDQEQKISLPETIGNFLAQRFEAGEKKVLLRNYYEDEKEVVVSFVGRKNWLPSKSLIKRNGTWSLNDDTVENRLIQDWVMSFVAKYDVMDYGLFFLKIRQGKVFIEKIDIFPDLSRVGLFALVWHMSGIDYEDLIKKIYFDSLNMRE